MIQMSLVCEIFGFKLSWSAFLVRDWLSRRCSTNERVSCPSFVAGGDMYWGGGQTWLAWAVVNDHLKLLFSEEPESIEREGTRAIKQPSSLICMDDQAK